MRFKRIYIEITNRCNLRCSFCALNDGVERVRRDIGLDEFENIISKVADYTRYVYLHVLGEPLLHENFREILEICRRNNIYVNITTNGVLLRNKIKDIIDSGAVRQINISLHSENCKKRYMEDILDSVGMIKDIYINYRFWTLDKNKLDSRLIGYYNKLCEYYGVSDISDRINDNTFVSYGDKFVWPDINNNYCNEVGYCLGLKDQIGILVDGTVVVCCLDSNGYSDLGNIFDEDLDKILKSDKCLKVMEGFNNRCVYLDICKHCSYKERFNR